MMQTRNAKPILWGRDDVDMLQRTAFWLFYAVRATLLMWDRDEMHTK